MLMEKRAHVCPVDAALEVISGKWKMRILWTLTQEPHRYGELHRAIPRVTEKMLAQQLRALCEDGLVHRESYPEVPPRVEYSLTERGRALTPHLRRLGEWSEEHLPDRIADASVAEQALEEA